MASLFSDPFGLAKGGPGRRLRAAGEGGGLVPPAPLWGRDGCSHLLLPMTQPLLDTPLQSSPFRILDTTSVLVTLLP
jgi:hypothetical protein